MQILLLHYLLFWSSLGNPCPLCKADLNDLQIKPAMRIVMRLIGELKVECNRCKCELNSEDSGHHICLHTPPVIAQPVLAPVVAPRVPPAQPAALTLEDAFEQLRQAENIHHKFQQLFILFTKCHFKYNGSAPMQDEDIAILGNKM